MSIFSFVKEAGEKLIDLLTRVTPMPVSNSRSTSKRLAWAIPMFMPRWKVTR